MKDAGIVEFIRKIELFRGLSDNGLETVATNIMEKSLDKGEYLFSEGAPRQNIYIIESGEVELFRKPLMVRKTDWLCSVKVIFWERVHSWMILHIVLPPGLPYPQNRLSWM